MRRTGILFAAAVVLAGCAKHSTEILSAQVSPMTYKQHTCKELHAEGVRVSRRAGELMHFINDKAEGDETATAVGLILLWPALFFIDGDGPEAYEYARLKGEMDAIEVAGIQKECTFKVERPKPIPKRDATKEIDTN